MSETANVTMAEVDALVVIGSGRKMHLAAKREPHHGGQDADALCGRSLYDGYLYPLDEEPSLPWDLCRRCAARRDQYGRGQA